MIQSFWLPFPPTANTMFGLKGYRRFPSKTYLAWRDDAAIALMQQKPIKMDGCVKVSIALKAPSKRKWDLDNRVKPILDLLVGHKVIEDDHSDIVRKVEASVGHQVGAEVTLETIA